MRRFARLMCALCMVCLLTVGAAPAEEGCGIGDAAFTEFVREPDQDGFSSWVETLDEGIATAADLVYGFFNSNEYTAKGKDNREIITDCYETMLNRIRRLHGRSTSICSAG